ncbi:MAG: hypothetical protein M3537_10100, partial [Chloroflexota bacterium]|nr:hypothetical protein [Chloroflexota bacterium]
MALNLGELFGTIGLDASEWDKKLKGAQGSLKAFGIGGAIMGAVNGLAIGAALSKGIADSINIEAGTDKLQAELGLTEAQAGAAGKAAGSLYAANYGGSMDDVNIAVAAVMSSIKGMRDASDADVEAMTAKMMNLSTVMGVDVGRAAQVAGQMITSGIATDGAHAADLLTASLQKVPAAVREDILDAVDEYGPFMNNLGIKGEEAMGLLVTASEKGMYGIDKTGDALKEFGIRATDMSEASGAGYEALGMDQEEMSAKLLAGGDTAKTAFGDIIHGLQEMEDPVAQSQAALALFGTPLEDLSVTEIPNFLGALDPMGDKFDSVAGAADQMGQDLTSNAKAGFDGFVRQADAALIGFVQDKIMPSVSDFASFLNTDVGPAIKKIAEWIDDTALPALRRFGDWLVENKDAIQGWATFIGIVMLPVFVRIAVAAAVSAAAQVVAWALAAGGAVKTAAVYVVQSYIMIGRFIAISAAAVGHGIVVAAVWTGQVIASAVSAVIAFGIQAGLMIGHWVAMAVASSINAIKMAAAWVVGVLVPAVAGAISMGIQAGFVIAAWVLMAVQSGIQAIIMAASWVVGVMVPAVIGGITMGIQAAIVVAAWVVMSTGAMVNAIKMAAAWFIALGPIGWIIAIVILLAALIIANWESISKFTSEAWENISKFVSEAWGNITRGVEENVGKILEFFRNLPGKIGEFFAGAGTWLLDAGKWIIDGFLDGLTKGFEEVKNFVGTIGDWIAKNKGPKAYD